MKKLINDIKNYIPYNEQEKCDKKMILKLLKEDDILTRKNQTHHFTASSWVASPDFKKVLMVYHNIYNSWSWIGGHADGESDLLAVALREAKEETGLMDVKPFNNDILSIEVLTVNGHFKNGEYVPSHLHLNVTYLLVANINEKLIIKPDENSGVKWINIEKIKQESTEKWMVDKIYAKLCEKVNLLREKSYE